MYLLERIGGKESLLPRFIALFREMAAEQVEALKVSIANGYISGIRKNAHKLKGAAANIAAQRIMETAARIESSACSGDNTLARKELNVLRQQLCEFNLCYRGISGLYLMEPGLRPNPLLSDGDVPDRR